MIGLPGGKYGTGTCQKWLDAREETTRGTYFEISQSIVLHQCESEGCNFARPDDPLAIGCPQSLDVAPWQTDILRTPAPGAPLSPEDFGAGAKAEQPEEPPPFKEIGIVF